ncbi:unnamed protein product [Closterium sp. Yama58-4]|nr:unnamed protein product [Closterium sp. Yama58-4]
MAETRPGHAVATQRLREDDATISDEESASDVAVQSGEADGFRPQAGGSALPHGEFEGGVWRFQHSGATTAACC